MSQCFVCCETGCSRCGQFCDRCHRFFCNKDWIGKTSTSQVHICHLCKKPKRPDVQCMFTHKDCGFQSLKRLQYKELQALDFMPELFTKDLETRGFIVVDWDRTNKTKNTYVITADNVQHLPDRDRAFFSKPLHLWKQSNHKTEVVIYATMYWQETNETLTNARKFAFQLARIPSHGP